MSKEWNIIKMDRVQYQTQLAMERDKAYKAGVDDGFNCAFVEMLQKDIMPNYGDRPIKDIVNIITEHLTRQHELMIKAKEKESEAKLVTI